MVACSGLDELQSLPSHVLQSSGSNAKSAWCHIDSQTQQTVLRAMDFLVSVDASARYDVLRLRPQSTSNRSVTVNRTHQQVKKLFLFLTFSLKNSLPYNSFKSVQSNIIHLQNEWTIQCRQLAGLRSWRPEERSSIWDRAREEGQQIPRGQGAQPQGPWFQYAIPNSFAKLLC